MNHNEIVITSSMTKSFLSESARELPSSL